MSRSSFISTRSIGYIKKVTKTKRDQSLPHHKLLDQTAAELTGLNYRSVKKSLRNKNTILIYNNVNCQEPDAAVLAFWTGFFLSRLRLKEKQTTSMRRARVLLIGCEVYGFLHEYCECLTSYEKQSSWFCFKGPMKTRQLQRLRSVLADQLSPIDWNSYRGEACRKSVFNDSLHLKGMRADGLFYEIPKDISYDNQMLARQAMYRQDLLEQVESGSYDFIVYQFCGLPGLKIGGLNWEDYLPIKFFRKRMERSTSVDYDFESTKRRKETLIERYHIVSDESLVDPEDLPRSKIISPKAFDSFLPIIEQTRFIFRLLFEHGKIDFRSLQSLEQDQEHFYAGIRGKHI